jgi:hypothetical protein
MAGMEVGGRYREGTAWAVGEVGGGMRDGRKCWEVFF